MPTFYDTHAHLDYPDFAGDLPQIIERARQAGVGTIISVATDLESSARAIKIAETFPDVYAAIGWHPGDALKAPEDLRPGLRQLASHPKVVAIGEIGLDYYRLPESPEEVAAIKRKQADIFVQQMEAAAEFGLNCVIHQRGRSLDDALALMAPFNDKVRSVFHCFSESPDALRRVLEIGALVSFTGIVTFKNADTLRDSVAAVPMDRFMLETDSPFLAPVPYRGKRCEPAYVVETARMVAEVKKCTLDALSEATCATARNFFLNRR